VNLFVRGAGDDDTPEEALGDFRLFPAWMWRNTDVVDFVAWLREWNDVLPAGRPKVGFYGLSHYFEARLAGQFDAVVHFDETRAVEPLERTSEWEARELPETYPWAV
jgi:erythromycin esterase-like protein